MRNKEVALNYACSLILPIDEATEEVLLIWANSRKLRMNAQLGNELIMEANDDDDDDSTETETEDDDEEGEGDDEGPESETSDFEENKVVTFEDKWG